MIGHYQAVGKSGSGLRVVCKSEQTRLIGSLNTKNPQETVPYKALLFLLITLTFLGMAACRKAVTWSDLSPHRTGFVAANGIRLNYLDWGGSGPVLILIHGLRNNPHFFDDFAPAFTDRTFPSRKMTTNSRLKASTRVASLIPGNQ